MYPSNSANLAAHRASFPVVRPFSQVRVTFILSLNSEKSTPQIYGRKWSKTLITPMASSSLELHLASSTVNDLL